MNTEYSISGKWLELLRQVVPNLTRVGVIRDVTNPSGIGQFGALQSATAQFRIELIPMGIRNLGEVERGIGAFAAEPNGGIIVPGGAASAVYRDAIISVAARHRIPTVYHVFVKSGGVEAIIPREAAHRLCARV